MAGYSGTPLVKKLGIKPGFKIIALFEPANYLDLLFPLPENVVIKGTGRSEVDFIHLFVKSRSVFEKEFLKNKKLIKKEGMLWVSWPKKSAKVDTDLDENVIRNVGLAHGLVDVKVCAVDEIWSALKFVYRIEDR